MLADADAPHFSHPYANTAYVLVYDILIRQSGLAANKATPVADVDKRSYGRQLERHGPSGPKDSNVLLRWGFSADTTGGDLLDTGHVYACMHYDHESVAVLCRCGDERTCGLWRLDVLPEGVKKRILASALGVTCTRQNINDATVVRCLESMARFFKGLPEYTDL